MPWIHFHASDKGTVKACCVANIPYGNIQTQSLTEIWNGEPIQAIREKFAKGIPDKRCFVCINQEKAGNESIRTETLAKYKDLVLDQIKSPIYFDIRFSNVCNFTCKTCWHGASSKWFEDAKRLGRNVSEKAIIQNITDFNDFIAKTGPSLLQAKEIYFAGGEPLVTEEHYLLLDYLIQNKTTSVFLRYNTNFSKLTFKKWDILDLWKQFNRVEVMASIDDSEAHGEYIRKGLNWEVFLANRQKIRSLPQVQFKLAPTISVFNVANIPSFYQKMVNDKIIEPENFYTNILERPYHFNCKILPLTEKKEITQQYTSFIANPVLPTPIKQAFQGIIDFMNQEDLHAKYYSTYLKEIDLLNFK